MDFFSAIAGGSVVGGLGYLLLKGVLAQLKNYNDLVVSYKNQNADLIHENAAQSKIIDEQRTVIRDAQVHLEACRRDGEISNRRIETMSLEIVDLKGQVRTLEAQIHGKEKID